MAPSVDPHARILEILSSRIFDRLKGLREDLYFEAKGKVPYDLNSAAGRYELAKDVSAFANSEGGHIVVGLQHRRLPNENTEEGDDLDLLPRTDFPTAQIGASSRSTSTQRSRIWSSIGRPCWRTTHEASATSSSPGSPRNRSSSL